MERTTSVGVVEEFIISKVPAGEITLFGSPSLTIDDPPSYRHIAADGI